MKSLTFILLFFVATLSAQNTEIIKMYDNHTLVIVNDTIVTIYNEYDNVIYDYKVNFMEFPSITNENGCKSLVYTGDDYAILYQPEDRIEIRIAGKRKVFYIK